MAESIIADKNPPCTMPGRVEEALVDAHPPHRRGVGALLHARQAQRQIAVRRYLEGHRHRLSVGPSLVGASPFTTVVAMTDTLFPGASELEGKTIREIAAVAMDAPAAANSGHSGTAMALAPLGVTFWGRVMRHDPTDPEWSDRDRFILSNGHACILQYALAHEFGYDLSVDDLRAFRQPHSRTPGHPERHCRTDRRGDHRPARPGHRQRGRHGDRRADPAQ